MMDNTQKTYRDMEILALNLARQEQNEKAQEICEESRNLNNQIFWNLGWPLAAFR